MTPLLAHPPMLALTFVAPVLLAGLAAAGIPFLLHLLSRARAIETPFPTLRFLRRSVENTARRRRLRDWLLLVLRALALAALAMAVAEPITRAIGAESGAGNQAAVILLDTSYSQAAGRGGTTRLAKAKAEAQALLSGREKPALAAVLTADGTAPPTSLTQRLDTLRQQVAETPITYGPPDLSGALARAAELLGGQNRPGKAIYLFTDLQKADLSALPDRTALGQVGDLSLFVIDDSEGSAVNVGITDLTISQQPIVGWPVRFRAELRNSSSTNRTVEVAFVATDGEKEVSHRTTRSLAPAGREGDTATVTFTHRFAWPGWVTGEIRLQPEDNLPADNVRYFCLRVAPGIRALVVRGPSDSGLSPGDMLSLALDPGGNGHGSQADPIRVEQRTAAELSPRDFQDADVAFFCDVPAFDANQADALRTFVQDGHTAMFFLGKNVRPEDYNRRLGTSGVNLLPGRLTQAVGQVGPEAPAEAVEFPDVEHSLLAGLFDAPADYPAILVQRRYGIESLPRETQVLLRLAGGAPLLIEHRSGRGKAFWCLTTPDPQWTNLPITPLFLPMVVRAAMQSPHRRGGNETYTAGQDVSIRPDEGGKASKIIVTFPDDSTEPRRRELPLDASGSAGFSETRRPGLYRWQTDGPDSLGGAFAVNPYGPESNLSAFEREEFRKLLRKKGWVDAYVDESLASVISGSAARAQGQNWWGVLAGAVILLLLVEAMAANRPRPS